MMRVNLLRGLLTYKYKITTALILDNGQNLKQDIMKGLLDFIHNTKTQAILAFTIVVFGLLLVWKGHLSDAINNRLFDLMFLTATFYFGSSKSGSEKDGTIAALANNASPTVAVTGDNTTVPVNSADIAK